NNVSKNLDIYPEYRVFTYDVVFMSDEKEVSAQVVEYGSDATAPFMANSEGKYFAGWDADYTNITSDLILFATWKNSISELEDAEICAATYNNLLSIIPETAKDQIDLPTMDDETGVAITWESSNHQIIRSTGKIVPDTENRVITLTANMSYGDYTCEYTFEVKVSRYYVDTTKGISAGYFYLTSSPVSQDALDTLDIFIMAFGSVSATGATSPGSAALYFVNNYLDEIHAKGGYVVISFINPDSFASFASTSVGRANFAASCVEMLNLYDIDGIDIDWETKVSTENYTLMIKELNRQIKANNESHLVISTVGGGPWAPNKFDTSAYVDDVDLVNLMTYGMQIGASRHQGALYEGTGTFSGCSVDASVKAYEKKGTPLNKMVVGIAFFGEQYEGSNGLSNGGTANDISASAKTYSYIASNYLNNSEKQDSIFFDNECGVPYVYDSGTGVFITYEDNESIRLKCEYVASNKLAGVMFWQYSQDNGDLISAISEYQSLYK
ncbi:MAG: glycoside hydrolase family 18 protein, partial [Bacilli bacterium]